MLSSIVLAALAVAPALGEDVLYSKRLSKRQDDSTSMTFLHINDVHAHLDEFGSSGTDCTRPERGCFGGIARIKTVLDELRAEHPEHLLINAGDEFQGTLFYSFYGPEKISESVNLLEYDIMTLGNHEWDGGDEELGLFLNNLTFPVVSANVISEYENLRNNIKRYHIFEEYGIAVIGVTTETTPSISSVGELTTFLDPIPAVQEAVYEIRNTTNITRIVALTHIGYDVDQRLAAETEGISLIIGGHSHTPLGNIPGSLGAYPTIVENINGDEVFVVTSYRWGEYLGEISITFDAEGRPLSYTGAPIHLTNTTAQDPEVQALVDSWRGPFEEFAAEVIGYTENELDQTTCQQGDCLLGQVMSDAMLEYRLNQTAGSPTRPDFALINAGGVRATIDVGNITRGEVLTSFPFGNAIVEITLTGAQVWDLIEGAVSRVNQVNGRPTTSWFQVSDNIQVIYNPDNQPGEVLRRLNIGGEPVEEDRQYRVVTLDFLAGGGDNLFTPTRDFATLDTQDEVLVGYIRARTPLTNTLQPRVTARSCRRPTRL
ncbi:Metallo-dependent phosphatase-like protein [Stachybotrys elegans]|uniref:Metallo-dependent phosphatase-like protein n=1 Tax=Stachybotrys elegans TaxID=80388 RepID=A0A8K0SMA6_9HYPO|nr:Metallo-dependent phosphatase-like protein [Stachybotrys elegans]